MEGKYFGSHELLANEVIRVMLKQTGADFETHYPELFKSIVAIAKEDRDEFCKMTLSCFRHHFSGYFFINEKGENCRAFTSFTENQAYKKGYNDAVNELREHFKIQEELVIESIKRAFTLKCD